ncbi:MAG: MlaD family protein [Clostridiaceae bacterium]|jgi:phospholipid/cholesterol/gamma-HCH transport system substrate-binding protein|nr:MlaD family protein [Clostridiaceae bacterium]
MKFSSSFKVGLLAIIALVLLMGVILKVKGRAFSSAERMEIHFKDVNGMRPGAGVQMMGLRVGQVEEITPVIKGADSYVKLKFVITDPTVSIPKASMFSIQQSGLIGELFLEITPPKVRTVYIPMNHRGILYKDDDVQMKLDDKYYSVGKIRGVQVVAKDVVPAELKEKVNTKYAYKVDYIIDLPGLIVPNFLKGKIVYSGGTAKLRIATLDDVVLPYPKQTSPYTIVEPMRISDFMDWQYKAAESLTETNKKVNDLLSDDVIAQLKQSVYNVNNLTAQTTRTMLKVDNLLDASKVDLDKLMTMVDKATTDFNAVSTNINDILGDPQFKKSIVSTSVSVDQLAKNVNKIIGNEQQSEQLAKDLRESIHNLNEISASVNSMTGDEKLKSELKSAVTNANTAMMQVSTALESVNKLTPDKKTELAKTMEDACVTTANLRKFSEKLNKRFLLFRLMF